MVLLALLAMSTPGSHAHKEPAWLDRSLAGYALLSDEDHKDIVVHDKRTGFFLVRQGECDGANINLLLTRDRKMVGGVAPGSLDIERKEKALPSLSTGKGLSMGASEGQTIALLGHPSKRERDGSRGQFLVLDYKWSQKGHGDEFDRNVDERYTFKNGKLIEIQFTEDGE